MDKQTTRWTPIHCPRQTEPFPLYPRIQRKTVHTPTAISTAAVSNSMMEDGREGKRGEEEVGSLVVHGDRGSAFRWMEPGS